MSVQLRIGGIGLVVAGPTGGQMQQDNDHGKPPRRPMKQK